MSIHVQLSGGLDSTTLLAHANDRRNEVRAWSFDYGQTHRRELVAAKQIARHYQVPHRILLLEGLLQGSALLNAAPLPEGHYTDETMRSTVVTGRNLLFTSTLIAQAHAGDEVWAGVHAGDHAIYPDCRPEFWDRLRAVVSDAYGVTLRTPFLHWTKTDIVHAAEALDAPIDLTWSCYAGGDMHCGRCGTCVERAEAFHLAHVTDPTDYADSTFWRSQCNVS